MIEWPGPDGLRLMAARGDLSAARSALEQALVEHRRVPQPFELARTLLVKGEVERRAKQKRAARSTLEQALGHLRVAFATSAEPQRAANEEPAADGCDHAIERTGKSQRQPKRNLIQAAFHSSVPFL